MFRKIRRLFAAFVPPRRRHCLCCDHRVGRFLPYRGGGHGAPSLMGELAVVGSDIDNFSCPRCGSTDRERHLLLYLEAAGLLPALKDSVILHFAPEPQLSRRIAQACPARHVKCDLYPTAPDVQRVDMLDMPFDDESFDFVIANHVLEHVTDDLRALSEIRRVLKVGGHAILQTPYSSKLHRTWQDDGIDDGAARLQAFGQEDHVRLYGRDIFERFVSAGFVSHVRQHADLLADVDVIRAGVNPVEPFFLFQRASTTTSLRAMTDSHNTSPPS